MRFNLADTFLNEHASPLLHYFQQPGLAEIGNGQLLQSVLRKIVDPPIFWNPFQQAFLNDTLTLDGQKAFGWLLLQLVSLPPGSSAPYRDDSNFNQHLSRLLSSDDLDLRTLGHKIKHAIQSPRDFYTGPRSPSRSISARPSEETQVFRSPAPPFTAMSATQATASSSNTLTSGSLSDAAMRRRQTAFEIRHIDIEIESAEANLARLQQLRSRLVELLAYDEEDF
ncbi:hypothetical protein EST38_g11173 [Candolleomyces aberdarensis]|uniref:Uncharacterized protein n=1 Tax=Candolleomyces aberdarensis TaxID=2316362 RepID=A0A4V1Q2D2_9AGAR|nr:hypothetical protein EST38_g11173 [Candolleomyces aberdarensis]